MAGGINEDGSLPIHIKDRCQLVLDQFNSANSLILASSSFSLNVPPKLDLDGYPISESSRLRAWLIDNGFKGKVLCEQLSHDTVGSILFSLMLFAKNFYLKKIKFVTSDFHVTRTKLIADFINQIVFKGIYEIDYISVKTSEDLELRKLHEADSAQFFRKEFSDCKNENDFMIKFLTNHTNYNHIFGSNKKLSKEFYY